jgi:hypothetical protein
MSVDYVTEVKIFPSTTGKLAARGSFVVADALAVNFSIFRAQDGTLRVVLPNTPNPKFDASKEAGKDNKKFYDEVRPISREAREELEAFLISKLDTDGIVPEHESPIPF